MGKDKFKNPGYMSEMPDDIKKIWKGLELKQRKFCVFYVGHSNATKAAKQAGYSEKSARQIGSENLSKPYIKAVKDWMVEYVTLNNLDESIMNAREIQQKLSRMARTDQSAFFDDNGDIDIKKATESGAIESLLGLKVSTESGGVSRIPITTKDIKIHDPFKAMSELNKMQGNYEPEERHIKVSEYEELTNEELDEELNEALK